MKKEVMFIIGSLSLTIAIFLGRFFTEHPIISFLEGMFTGISMVMNIAFLYRFGRERHSSINIQEY